MGHDLDKINLNNKSEMDSLERDHSDMWWDVGKGHTTYEEELNRINKWLRKIGGFSHYYNVYHFAQWLEQKFKTTYDLNYDFKKVSELYKKRLFESELAMSKGLRMRENYEHLIKVDNPYLNLDCLKNRKTQIFSAKAFLIAVRAYEYREVWTSRRLYVEYTNRLNLTNSDIVNMQKESGVAISAYLKNELDRMHVHAATYLPPVEITETESNTKTIQAEPEKGYWGEKRKYVFKHDSKLIFSRNTEVKAAIDKATPAQLAEIKKLLNLK